MTLPIEPERARRPDIEILPVGASVADSPIIACDLTAIPSEQRAAHQTRAEHLLFDAVCEVRELPNGYALRLAAEDYLALADFIANERLCCPFFTFGLEVTPERGPIWLSLTGREGVKEFLHATLLPVQSPASTGGSAEGWSMD